MEPESSWFFLENLHSSGILLLLLSIWSVAIVLAHYKYCDFFEGIYSGLSEGLGQSVYFPEVPCECVFPEGPNAKRIKK